MNDPGSGHATQFVEIMDNSTDYTQIIDDWKRDRGIAFVLAFSGGADDRTPILTHLRAKIQDDQELSEEHRTTFNRMIKDANGEIVANIVREILTPLRGYRIAVQTGGCQFEVPRDIPTGVPAIVTHVAKELGFPTIGVFPLNAKVKKYVLDDDLLDLAVCVHPFIDKSYWGDESAIFTKLLDAVIVIGGGAGTLVEVAHLLKINERKDGITKHIVPIRGTGGTAEAIHSFPGRPETMNKCLPKETITTGQRALEYLLQNAFMEDMYEPREGI